MSPIFRVRDVIVNFYHRCCPLHFTIFFKTFSLSRDSSIERVKRIYDLRSFLSLDFSVVVRLVNVDVLFLRRSWSPYSLEASDSMFCPDFSSDVRTKTDPTCFDLTPGEVWNSFPFFWAI